MNNTRLRKLTAVSMLTALVWFLTFTPIGFTVPFFGISMTFVHIPAIVAAMTEGLGGGLAVSFMFGLASLVKNLTCPTSVYSYMLQNPLVSILPRLAIGPAVYLCNMLLKRLLKKHASARRALCGIIGAAVNTVCTLTAFTLCAKLSSGYSAVTAVSVWSLAANCPIECLSAAVVNMSVVGALSKIYKQPEL